MPYTSASDIDRGDSSNKALNTPFPSPELIAKRLAAADRDAAAFFASLSGAEKAKTNRSTLNTRSSRASRSTGGNRAQRGGGGHAPLGKNTKLVVSDLYDEILQELEIKEEKAASRERQKWLIQDAAANLMRGRKQERVCFCQRTIAHGAQSVECQIIEEERARWGNLLSCGSVWTCPGCSARISAERGKEANTALAWARKKEIISNRGNMVVSRVRATPMLLTLTARHGRGDELADLTEKMLAAKRSMFQHDTWRDMRVKITRAPVFLKKIGEGPDGESLFNETLEDTGNPVMIEVVRTTKPEPVIGKRGKQLTRKGKPMTRRVKVEPYTVKKQKTRAVGWVKGSGCVMGMIVALEVTHTKAGGWHPHFHIVVFVDTGTEKQAAKLLTKMRKIWIQSLKTQGLYARGEVGFRIDGGASAGTYVSKFGAGTGIEISGDRKADDAVSGKAWVGDEGTKAARSWGMAEELTGSHAKRDKKEGAGANPWQLLEYHTFAEDAVIESREDLTPAKAGALFVEFGEAFHGKQQLQWSPGLKDLVGLLDKTDEEIIEAADEAESKLKRILASVAPWDWKYLCSFTKYSERREFLIGMQHASPAKFWLAFEAFLGRKPDMTLDNLRRENEGGDEIADRILVPPPLRRSEKTDPVAAFAT